MFSIAYPNLNVGRDFFFFFLNSKVETYILIIGLAIETPLTFQILSYSIRWLSYLFFWLFFLMVTSSLFDSQEAKNNPGYGIA